MRNYLLRNTRETGAAIARLVGPASSLIPWRREKATFVLPLIWATVILLPINTAPAFAADPFVGMWRLNVAKSSYATGVDVSRYFGHSTEPPRGATDRIEAQGDRLVVTDDRTLSDGKAIHTVLTIRFDGVGVPAANLGTGAEGFAKRTNDRTIVTTFKSHDKIIATRTRIVSEDGNTLTLATQKEMSDGNVSEYREVFERMQPGR